MGFDNDFDDSADLELKLLYPKRWLEFSRFRCLKLNDLMGSKEIGQFPAINMRKTSLVFCDMTMLCHVSARALARSQHQAGLFPSVSERSVPRT